jgi:hypothetical protein
MNTDLNTDMQSDIDAIPTNWHPNGASFGQMSAADVARHAWFYHNHRNAELSDPAGRSIIGGLITAVSLVSSIVSYTSGMRERTSVSAADDIRLQINIRNLTLHPITIQESTHSNSRFGSSPVILSGESALLPYSIGTTLAGIPPVLVLTIGAMNEFTRLTIEVRDYGGDSCLRAVATTLWNRFGTLRPRLVDPRPNQHHTQIDSVFYRDQRPPQPDLTHPVYTVVTNSITNGITGILDLTIIGYTS